MPPVNTLCSVSVTRTEKENQAMKSCPHSNSDGFFIPLAFSYSISILLAESNVLFVLIPAPADYLDSFILFSWTDWQDLE